MRRDFADYLGEVQAADAMFRTMLEELEAAEELDNTADSWEDAPAPADGNLVGQFEIPRTQLSGPIEITGDALVDFVKTKAGHSATFIVVRETTDLEGMSYGLTHALASSSHPGVAGPVLELHLKEEQD